MLTTIGRAVVTFLLGAIVGAGATGWFFYSGAGDGVLRPGPVVRDLERRLEEVEAQRDQLGRSLEDVMRRAEQSEARFRGLEERLQAVITASEDRPEPARPSAPSGGQPEGE